MSCFPLAPFILKLRLVPKIRFPLTLFGLDPNLVAMLSVTSLFVIVNSPELSMPPELFAELPEIVLSLIDTDASATLEIPPPNCPAELPVIALSEMVSVPLFKTPPADSEAMAIPPVIVTPEIPTVAPART